MSESTYDIVRVLQVTIQSDSNAKYLCKTMRIPEAMITMAEKSATSSSVNCSAFILSAKSNMESRRKPALFVTCK